MFDDRGHACGAVHTTVAVIAYPRVSNLDEFQPLRQLPGVRLSWAREPRDLAGADWVILPGSKATAADLAWLRAQKLDAALNTHRGRVLGICGGLQMLGEALIDPHGLDGNAIHTRTRTIVTLGTGQDFLVFAMGNHTTFYTGHFIPSRLDVRQHAADACNVAVMHHGQRPQLADALGGFFGQDVAVKSVFTLDFTSASHFKTLFGT